MIRVSVRTAPEKPLWRKSRRKDSSDKDYLRLAKSESGARQLFQELLANAGTQRRSSSIPSHSENIWPFCRNILALWGQERLIIKKRQPERRSGCLF